MKAAEELDRLAHNKLPFYSIRIDEFEGKVKRFAIFENPTFVVTFKQLQFAFKNDTEFNKDITNPKSELYGLLTSDKLCSVDSPSKDICVFKLMILFQKWQL